MLAVVGTISAAILTAFALARLLRRANRS